MQEIIKGDAMVMDALEKECHGSEAIRHTTDSFGNAYNWYRLDNPEKIWNAAQTLHVAHARLAIIAASGKRNDELASHDICYEFVLDGIVYGITVVLDKNHDSVPSITHLFANADWHEREMMELYGINVTGHPNPRRLFLDEELDKGLLGEIVPLSIMMNGASSTDLWERILADKESGR